MRAVVSKALFDIFKTTTYFKYFDVKEAELSSSDYNVKNYTLTLSAQKIWTEEFDEETTTDEIIYTIKGIVRNVVNELFGISRNTGEPVLELVYSDATVKDIVNKIIKLRDESIIVTLDEQLNIVPPQSRKWRKVASLFSCWGREAHILGHPVYWLRDAELILNSGFIFYVTEEQQQALDMLAEAERQLMHTAYIYPSKKGYVLFIWETLREIHNDLFRKLSVECHDIKTGESYKLVFIQHVGSVNDLEKTIDEKYKDEACHLYFSGYTPFEGFMFTYPSLLKFLKIEGIEVVSKLVLPIYEKINVQMERKYSMEGKWEFQKEAITNWINNGYFGTVVVPTGGGKTLIGCEAIYTLRLKTVIVVPTIELLFQFKRFLIEKLSIKPHEIGLFYGLERETEKPIVIATYQLASRRIKELEEEENGETLTKEEEAYLEEMGQLIEKAGLLIMDEGHHAPAPIFSKIMLHIKTPYRLSLTATPYREDKNETLMFFALGNVVFDITYNALVYKEVVAPIDYNVLFVPFTDEEREFIKRKAEIDYKKRRAIVERSAWLYERAKEDEEELLMEYRNFPIISYFSSNGTPKRISLMTIIRFAKNKFAKLLELVEKHKEDKIIIFNERVKGAELIYELLKKQGYSVQLIYGTTEKYARKEALKIFAEAQKGILVTTVVLDEGVDVPDANVIIIFNGRKTPRQTVQRTGRGCRWRKGKVETVYELVAVDDVQEAKMIYDNFVKGKKHSTIDYIIDKLKDGMALSAIPCYDEEHEQQKWLLAELAVSLYRSPLRSGMIDKDFMRPFIEKALKEREQMKPEERTGQTTINHYLNVDELMEEKKKSAKRLEDILTEDEINALLEEGENGKEGI